MKPPALFPTRGVSALLLLIFLMITTDIRALEDVNSAGAGAVVGAPVVAAAPRSGAEWLAQQNDQLEQQLSNNLKNSDSGSGGYGDVEDEEDDNSGSAKVYVTKKRPIYSSSSSHSHRRPAVYNNNHDNTEEIIITSSASNNNGNTYQPPSTAPATTTYNNNNYKHRVLYAQAQRPSRPQTLSDIYGNNTSSQLLLRLNFASAFDDWNPRNNFSQWQWFPNGTFDEDNVADNAIIILPGAGGAYQQKNVLEGDYGTSGGGGGYGDGVQLLTAPFSRWYNQSDIRSVNSSYEARVQWKNNATVGAAQRILFRLKCSCFTTDTDKHPFPPSLVSNPYDERLANCFFGIYPVGIVSSVEFSFSITNIDVWAVYASFDNQRFVAKRRVGVRQAYDDIVDAAFDYDALLNQATFWLNGVAVWTIYAIGVPPPLDGLTKIDFGQGTQRVLPPLTAFTAAFGLRKNLDESDPQNIGNTTRLVRITTAQTMRYGLADQFYDPLSRRRNSLWGQAAKMTVYKFVIVRADSRPLTMLQQQPSNSLLLLNNNNVYRPALPSSNSYGNDGDAEDYSSHS